MAGNEDNIQKKFDELGKISPNTSMIQGKGFSFESNDYLVTLVASKAFNQKKVKATEKEVYDIVKSIFSYIDKINSLNKDVKNIGDYSVSDILIIDEFRDFILPSEVRVDLVSQLTNNVRTKSITHLKAEFDLNEFNNCQARFRNLFKKNFADNRSKVEDLRTPTTLFDMMARAAVTSNGAQCYKVRLSDSAFVPIFIDFDLSGLYFSEYYNVEEKDLFARYFMDVDFGK